MTTKLIETKQFACVAEAGSYYQSLGFSTFNIPSDLDCRYMRNADHSEEVRIRHNGLLDVDASHIAITV